MTPVTAPLSREHQVVLSKLKEFERSLNEFDLEGIRSIVRFFDEQLVLHRRKEEEVLFPILGRHIGSEAGPIACMLAEHQDEQEKISTIRRLVETIPAAESTKKILEAGRYILDLLRNHIAKEDVVLFPMAEEMLTDDEKTQVQHRMAEIGFCCSECGVN